MFLSFCIEDSIGSIFNIDSDRKAYLSKVQSISFNIKKNEVSMESVANQNYENARFILIIIIISLGS